MAGMVMSSWNLQHAAHTRSARRTPAASRRQVSKNSVRFVLQAPLPRRRGGCREHPLSPSPAERRPCHAWGFSTPSPARWEQSSPGTCEVSLPGLWEIIGESLPPFRFRLRIHFRFRGGFHFLLRVHLRVRARSRTRIHFRFRSGFRFRIAIAMAYSYSNSSNSYIRSSSSSNSSSSGNSSSNSIALHV
jgi:hypothetical protein